MAEFSKYGFKNHFDVVNTSRFYFDDINIINLKRDPKDKNKFTYEDSYGNTVGVEMLKDGSANIKLDGKKVENLSVDELAYIISNGDIEELVELKEQNKKMIDSYKIGGKLTKSQITGKEKGKLLDVLYKAKFDAEQAGNKNDVTLIEKLISKSIKGADISDSVEFKSLFAQGGNYFGFYDETPDTELNFQPSYDYAKGGYVNFQILSFSFNTNNISIDEIIEIVEKYTRNWRTSGGTMDDVSMHVTLIPSQVNDLASDLRSVDAFNFRTMESRLQFLSTHAKGGYIISGAKDKVTDLELDEVIEEIKYGYGWATIPTIRQLIDYVTKDKKYNLDDKVYNKDGLVYQILGYGDEQTIIEYLRDGIYIFPTEDDEKLGNTSEDINILSIQQIKKDTSGPWATSGTSIDKYYLSVYEELGEQDIYEWAKDLWRTSPEAPISHSFELEESGGVDNNPNNVPLYGYLNGRNEWVLTVKETIYYN